mmetsp:Transcript_12054/g.28575  ORF Transcript_12054/g.28575 Transcript_12054/m.28575 type:complete len:166 (+) Transcript_12054:48-545(+)|eukprot:CAMPEP_0181399052 /NCGR_PEP_ID=MMETSP1110-20121109/1379_1 /TAXON_ID=174948 /ORGANISM="Symbiodinium sp., Strain CCMP421" /LENGTH=165 /DNA_ID=CAMNT_0023521065 /DNA_START=24 /DNA_END=521 /DNA_ORIENTATION=+
MARLRLRPSDPRVLAAALLVSTSLQGCGTSSDPTCRESNDQACFESGLVRGKEACNVEDWGEMGAKYQSGFEDGYAAGKKEVLKLRKINSTYTWSDYAFDVVTDVVILMLVILGFGRLERCFYRTKEPAATAGAQHVEDPRGHYFSAKGVTKSYEASIQHENHSR